MVVSEATLEATLEALEATLVATQHKFFLVCQVEQVAQEERAEDRPVQDPSSEVAKGPLLELGTPQLAALAPLPTTVPMATLAPGSLVALEEVMTAHGALDSAPDTTKAHTQLDSTQDMALDTAQDMDLASAMDTAVPSVATDMEATVRLDQAVCSSPRPSEGRALPVPAVQGPARRHPAARAASDA